MGARRMWNRRSVAVVADPLPSTSIQFHAFTPKRAGDLVVASAGCPSTAASPRQTERGASNGVARSVGRSVGRLYLSSCLSFMSLSSQVPLRLSPLPTCGVWTAAPASSLSSSDPSRAGRREERREGEQKSIVSLPLKNVHNSSHRPPFLRGFLFPLLAFGAFFAFRECTWWDADGRWEGKGLLSN